MRFVIRLYIYIYFVIQIIEILALRDKTEALVLLNK